MKLKRMMILGAGLVSFVFLPACSGNRCETMRHDGCAVVLQGGHCGRVPKYGYAFCYTHKDSGGRGVQCHAVVNGVRCSAICNPKYIFCLPHKDCWKIVPTLPDPCDWTAKKGTVTPSTIQTLPYTTCAYNADGGSCSRVPKYGYAYCYTHKDMAKRRMTGGQCHAVVDGVRCKKTCKPAYIFCYEHKDCWRMGPTLSR